MKTISISDNAHKKMTDEIDEAKRNGTYPLPTYGTIIEESINKRYKSK